MYFMLTTCKGVFMYPEKWCDCLIDIDIYCWSKFWLLNILSKTYILLLTPRSVTGYFYSILKIFIKIKNIQIKRWIIILKILENKFEKWNSISLNNMWVLYMYIMYIQCIILSFCISLSISFFMYIFIDFVLLLYSKSKSKWIIINRVYKNYVCNASNSHRLFLYMNLLEKFRTWYNN